MSSPNRDCKLQSRSLNRPADHLHSFIDGRTLTQVVEIRRSWDRLLRGDSKERCRCRPQCRLGIPMRTYPVYPSYNRFSLSAGKRDSDSVWRATQASKIITGSSDLTTQFTRKAIYAGIAVNLGLNRFTVQVEMIGVGMDSPHSSFAMGPRGSDPNPIRPFHSRSLIFGKSTTVTWFFVVSNDVSTHICLRFSLRKLLYRS